MDEIEGSVLAGIPPQALKLTLARSTIKMQHSRHWVIDKVNRVEDLLICLQGEGRYVIDGETYLFQPGDALLIPRKVRFRGWNAGLTPLVGMAQHFDLTIFDQDFLTTRMELKPKVHLSRWSVLEPLVRHFRQNAPATSTTLWQHHLFMFFLISFIDDAFVSWRTQETSLLEKGDTLALSIMLAAAQISADPLKEGIAEEVVDNAPYNQDYFLREFRRKIGWTPKKYQEFKRMERAMHFLEIGKSVKESAAAVGYHDVYYFSRMFKRHIGTSPKGYVEAVKRSRDGTTPIFHEDHGKPYPILPVGSKIDQITGS